MAISPERSGDDLRLLRDLERQDDRSRGEDLETARRPESGEIDLDRWSGVDNLKQALYLRFLTHRGELAILGHRDYGSRLHELIGEPNTETNRNRAKVYALQALQAEPRVAEIVSLDVRTRRAQPNRIDIDVQLRPVTSDTVLNLVFPLFL